jgi:hypothetical protein
MDGTAGNMKEKLDQLLREAAEVSVALDRADGTIVGVPHYSVIEARAHELGQELSRRIQTRRWSSRGGRPRRPGVGKFRVRASCTRRPAHRGPNTGS